MNKKELINQLESLMANQMDFIDPDDSDDIFRKDVEALKLAIKIIKIRLTMYSNYYTIIVR